jgi:hypothetical protein
LSINESFLHVSSHVMAEPLLILLTLLGWYLMTRALDAPRPTAWRSRRRPAWWRAWPI